MGFLRKGSGRNGGSARNLSWQLLAVPVVGTWSVHDASTTSEMVPRKEPSWLQVSLVWDSGLKRGQGMGFSRTADELMALGVCRGVYVVL